MSCKDNIDLRPAFINSFYHLYDYASNRQLPNFNSLQPSSETYGDSILNTPEDFLHNFSSNIDIDNFIGSSSDIIQNKDNFFIINNSNNNIYENCVITSGVPWFTTNNNFNKCEISKNIQLDDKNILSFSDDKKSINYNFKSKNKNAAFCSHYSNVQKAYCENSWHDWLIIPNYYLGNTYYKDIGKYNVNDVYKCYQPCDGDFIPFTTSKKEMKCIPKNLYSGGILMNKYKYSALGLINLIGNIAMNNNLKDNNKTNLILINYYLIFYFKHKKNIDTNIYDKNIIYDDIDNIISANDSFNKYKPYINKIHGELIDAIKKNILDTENFDNSLNQNYNSLNVFSYNSTEFHETTNDLISISGLDYNNILIDPILIHIWILANLFRPYDENDITNNINTDSDISYTELYDLLNDGNKFDGDAGKNINMSIRLKNIFFKAVNVCYNGKTSFSANIISKTKKALQNNDLINLIHDKELYIIPQAIIGTISYKNSNKKKFDIFQSKETLKTFLQNFENLDTFTEIKYYNEIDLNEFIASKSSKNATVKKIIGDISAGIDDNTKYKYLFSVEYLEASNKCKINEVYNPITGMCDKRPPKMIVNIKKNENIDDIEDEFKIPQLKYLFTLFIQGLFVIIIIYLFYSFYNIFIETVLSFINWVVISINDIIDDSKIYSLERKIKKYDESKDIIDEKIKIANIISKKEILKQERLQRNINILKAYAIDNHLEGYEEEMDEEDDKLKFKGMKGLTEREKLLKQETKEKLEKLK